MALVLIADVMAVVARSMRQAATKPMAIMDDELA